jgi:hypothetical protein
MKILLVCGTNRGQAKRNGDGVHGNAPRTVPPSMQDSNHDVRIVIM